MTVKEYLSQVHESEKIIKYYEQKIEVLRVQAGGLRAITYDKDRVQVSPTNTLMESVAKLVDLEAEYGKEIIKHHQLILKITRQVNALDNPDHVEILRLRYLTPFRGGRFMPLAVVARKMDRSVDWTWHLHGAALNAFRKKYFLQ